MKTVIKIIFTSIISAVLLCGCNNTPQTPTSSDDNSNITSYTSSQSSDISENTSDNSVPESSSESSFSESSAESSIESSIQESSEISTVSEPSVNSEVSTPESSEPTVSTPVENPSEFDFSDKYFVNKLNPKMLKNFTAAYRAVTNFESSVTFDQIITSDELDTIMYLLNYDCPELIQISGDYYPYYTNYETYDVSGVGFDYIMNKKEHKKAIGQLNSFFDKLKKDIGDKTELEKEKYVYDYIFDKCVYNETDKMSGSVYGLLIKNKGRCEAICKSFMWCMRELDVECMCVSGSQNWNDESLYASHSWNIIKINGKYYHLDLTVDRICTEDDNEKYPANYGFFNVNDDLIKEGREINKIFTSLGVPKCNTLKDNYHVSNGLYIDDKKQIQDAFNAVLTENFDNGFDNISIKFKYQSAYDYAQENCDSWISDFLSNISDKSFSYLYYLETLSDTITIYAEPIE